MGSAERGAPAGQQQRWAVQRRRSVLLPVLGLAGLSVPSLIIVGFVTTNIGTGPVLVGTVAAVLPVIPVVAAFLWIDRWEPEPPKLLLAAFLWGAGVAVLASVIVNDTVFVLGQLQLGRGGGAVVSALVSAPIFEEAFKGAFLLGLLWWRSQEFDGRVDGVVYAGLVAVGFAFTENILYFARAFATDGLVGAEGGLVTVFILRAVISPFAHPLFTAMTGLGIGAAARARSRPAKVVLPVLGYLAAVLAHGLWNASAGLGLLLVVYPLIMVPLFVGLVALVLWQRRRERRVVAAQLPQLAEAGWIAPGEVSLLSSLSGRAGWRAAVRDRAGDQAARAVHDYHTAVTELAFLRDRMARGTVGPDAERWHQDLQASLARARAQAVGSPDALTAAWRGPPPADWTPPSS